MSFLFVEAFCGASQDFDLMVCSVPVYTIDPPFRKSVFVQNRGGFAKVFLVDRHGVLRFFWWIDTTL